MWIKFGFSNIFCFDCEMGQSNFNGPIKWSRVLCQIISSMVKGSDQRHYYMRNIFNQRHLIRWKEFFLSSPNLRNYLFFINFGFVLLFISMIITSNHLVSSFSHETISSILYQKSSVTQIGHRQHLYLELLCKNDK